MGLSTGHSRRWFAGAVAVVLTYPLAAFAQTPSSVSPGEPAPDSTGIPTPNRVASWVGLSEEKAEVDGTRFPSPNCENACAQSRPWKFRAILYGWVPGFHGDINVGGVRAPVDATIGKVWNVFTHELEFAALGQIEASNGRCGFIINGIYADVSPSDEVRRLSFSARMKLTLLDMVGTYNLEHVPDVLGLPHGSQIQLLAGARYYAFTSALTATGPAGNSASAGGTLDWWDPIIGCRLRVPLCQSLTGQVRADAGGFGIRAASQYSWNVESTLEYRFSPHCSFIGGWRWLNFDRETDNGRRSVGFNLLMSGPLAGFAVDF